MKYILSKLSFILTGIVGGAVVLASSGVYASSEVSEELQYSLVAYHEDGFDGTKSFAPTSKYELFAGEIVAIEENSLDDWLDSNSAKQETGVGLGVTPLFDSYGVVRASGNHKSTYLALGYISDELTMDEADSSDENDERGFSYGFGVNNSSSNFEYMMSVDQGNRNVSAIGMRFTSEF